ncbi:MAG: lipopolysaccharide transport periplasmic protein LptA [Nitrospiraceae bacterium]|nr:lipopolysaccharide transport periplasmic protein LptA [Nitrospiraceae bacterium]
MSRRFFRNSVLFAFSVLLAGAAPPFSLEKGKREPIVITSGRMEADKLDDTVVFRDNVVLKKEGITLNSDVLTVHYEQGARGVHDIEAQGNVVVRQEGRVALSSKAVYYSKEEKIVLTGEPRIVEKDNELRGEKITIFIREDRSLVESGKVRFYQDAPVRERPQRMPIRKQRTE